MSKSLEIVEVTMTRVKKGARSYVVFEDHAISRPDPGDWKDLKLFDINDRLIAEWPDDNSFTQCEVPEDWVGLNFRCIGQCFDRTTSGGMEWEIENVGAADVFADYADEFIKTGNEMLDGDGPRTDFGYERPNSVKFLTVWEYEATKDYDGEWDMDYQLLGVADVSKLKLLIQPVDMLLFCPNCGEQHVDAPDEAKGWNNPPHRSHECQFCTGDDGQPFVWRPADTATNGVQKIYSKGKLDGNSRPRYFATANDFANAIETQG